MFPGSKRCRAQFVLHLGGTDDQERGDRVVSEDLINVCGRPLCPKDSLVVLCPFWSARASVNYLDWCVAQRWPERSRREIAAANNPNPQKFTHMGAPSSSEIRRRPETLSIVLSPGFHGEHLVSLQSPYGSVASRP